ncbi:MAG: ribonuclease HII [Alphaproteobacteria bacterium]|nr:ribonuclease HII [Alphaproteobacteria bacterium]
MPDYHLEAAHGGIVAGIDEVGRGPLAGPVVAAAVVLDPERLGELAGLDDSKALSGRRRRILDGRLRAAARIGLGAASVAEIDRLNILQASLLAMARALAALEVRPDLALVDGNRAPAVPCAVRTVVRGDAACLSIAAASVVAKVTRDRLMARLAAVYPGYGWERNAGYGTAQHRAAIDKHGVTPHHRRSFSPISQLSLISD